MIPLSAHQMRFMDLFKSQCDQLKKEIGTMSPNQYKAEYASKARAAYKA